MTADRYLDRLRFPYSLRHVPRERLAGLTDVSEQPSPGDIVLASVERIAKNSSLELNDGRRCTLHEGDTIAAVFGNRYATLQFEGLAGKNGDSCDLLSMGGLCGLVQTKHARVSDPTKLKLIGAITDQQGLPLSMRDHRLQRQPAGHRPHVTVVCGSSMDAGKTHTAMSIIKGLSRAGKAVAGIKLTGTATGKDTWNMLDAGACVALDFVDGGYPSTYLCGHDELIELHHLLVDHAASRRADYVVMEIADGLLQRETSMLLQSAIFAGMIDCWVFAGGDPMSAESGVRLMRGWGIEPIAVSGVLTMSSLNIREVEAATGLSCVKAGELQAGWLNDRLVARLPQETAHLRRIA